MAQVEAVAQRTIAAERDDVFDALAVVAWWMKATGPAIFTAGD